MPHFVAYNSEDLSNVLVVINPQLNLGQLRRLKTKSGMMNYFGMEYFGVLALIMHRHAHKEHIDLSHQFSHSWNSKQNNSYRI